MRKKQSPQQKKRLSLQHDRRSTAGENTKSKRKNTPLEKQRSHQQERHAVDITLHSLTGAPDDAEIEDIEGAAKTVGRREHLRSFKKTPDKPLGDVIKTKTTRRKQKSQPKR